MDDPDKMPDAGVAKRGGQRKTARDRKEADRFFGELVAKHGDVVLLQALDAAISRYLDAHPQYRGPKHLPNAAGAARVHETVKTLERIAGMVRRIVPA